MELQLMKLTIKVVTCALISNDVCSEFPCELRIISSFVCSKIINASIYFVIAPCVQKMICSYTLCILIFIPQIYPAFYCNLY